MEFRLSYPQRAMLEALLGMVGDRTVSALAQRAGTNPGSAVRTLRSLEDAVLETARELAATAREGV